MPSYIYKARDERGKPVKGRMEAFSSDDLIAKLHNMGYITTSVTVVQPGINLEEIAGRFQPVKTQDLLIFNFQLANMLESGLSILSCLRTIAVQLENKKFKEIVGDVQRNIEAGNDFSASLNNHPKVFNKLFISMVKAGEESGRLNEVLKRYAVFVEAQQELRERIKGALFYPAILVVAACGVIVFIVTFIIPQFVDMFSKAGVDLPFTTRILFKTGLVLKSRWYLILGGLAVLFWGLKKYLASEKGKSQRDTFILKVPLVGSVARKVYVARFSRALATLLSSGVPILQSLDITKGVVGNTVMCRAIIGVRQSLEQGQKIAEPLKISGEFPLDAVQMIAAGEESGQLDGMLNKIADFYDMTVGYFIKKLTTIIEPVFLVIMGGVVAFIMASMLLPIFDMVKILRH